jgi:hypothetical protein
MVAINYLALLLEDLNLQLKDGMASTAMMVQDGLGVVSVAFALTDQFDHLLQGRDRLLRQPAQFKLLL